MTMRGWQYGYHNHLQKLGAHLQEGQIEEAKKYIGELEAMHRRLVKARQSRSLNLAKMLGHVSVYHKHDMKLEES